MVSIGWLSRIENLLATMDGELAGLAVGSNYRHPPAKQKTVQKSDCFLSARNFRADSNRAWSAPKPAPEAAKESAARSSSHEGSRAQAFYVIYFYLHTQE
jgi:hypothetical protein